MPVSKFERLGIHRDRLNKMVAEEHATLLRGFPTSMKFLIFRDEKGTEHKVNARLSLYRTSDGQLDIKVHPFRKTIKNDLNLTEKELVRLQAGTSVIKDLKAPEVKQPGRYLVQLDARTNELRWIRTDQIRFNRDPGDMSKKDRISLVNGQAVHIRQKDGKSSTLRLDLFHPALIRRQTGLERDIKSMDDFKPSRQRGLKR